MTLNCSRRLLLWTGTYANLLREVALLNICLRGCFGEGGGVEDARPLGIQNRKCCKCVGRNAQEIGIGVQEGLVTLLLFSLQFLKP